MVYEVDLGHVGVEAKFLLLLRVQTETKYYSYCQKLRCPTSLKCLLTLLLETSIFADP